MIQTTTISTKFMSTKKYNELQAKNLNPPFSSGVNHSRRVSSKTNKKISEKDYRQSILTGLIDITI